VYKDRLDSAWKKVTVDWVNGTMELAIVLWEARQATKADQAFGKWLTEQGYGPDVISRQNRSALMQYGIPEHRQRAREILTQTHRSCWEMIWLRELKPDLIETGGCRNLRQPRNKITIPNDNVPSGDSNVTPLPVKSKSKIPTEREMALATAEAIGLTATFEIGEPPKIGRMPDDTDEKIREHVQEIYARCHELFQLCLYHEQMSDGYKQQIAEEFRSIKRWGERLAKMVLGHNKLSQINAPLCHVNVPLRKDGNS
jgi:hypothetical protein